MIPPCSPVLQGDHAYFMQKGNLEPKFSRNQNHYVYLANGSRIIISRSESSSIILLVLKSVSHSLISVTFFHDGLKLFLHSSICLSFCLKFLPLNGVFFVKKNRLSDCLFICLSLSLFATLLWMICPCWSMKMDRLLMVCRKLIFIHQKT